VFLKRSENHLPVRDSGVNGPQRCSALPSAGDPGQRLQLYPASPASASYLGQ